MAVEQYLASLWRPDQELINGRLVERSLGLKDHSSLQTELILWFSDPERASFAVFPSLRIRVREDRFRVPDICVLDKPEPDEQVRSTPPFICVEVLSAEDTWRVTQDRLDDLLDMGVPNVWSIDPSTRRAWRITHAGHLEVLDGILRTTDGRVALPLAELFVD